MTRVRLSGPNGISRAARPPRSRSVSARRCSDDMTPTSSATSDIPSTDAAAARTSREIRSAAGQPTMVRTMLTCATSPVTEMSRTMSSSPMGRRSSGSVTASTARRTAFCEGLRHRAALSCARSARESSRSSAARSFAAQDFAGDDLVGDIGQRHPQRHDLAGEVFRVGEVALRALAVLLDLHPVAVVLTVLREQDERRSVRGLQRQDERQQREVRLATDRTAGQGAPRCSS